MNIILLGQNKIFDSCIDYFLNNKQIFGDFYNVKVIISPQYNLNYKNITHHSLKNVNNDIIKQICTNNNINMLISIQYPKIYVDSNLYDRILSSKIDQIHLIFSRKICIKCTMRPTE